MRLHNLEFQQTGAVSRLMLDYVNEAPQLLQFINNFPSYQAFADQTLQQKQAGTNRELLVSSLKAQYETDMPGWEKNLSATAKNIESLLDQNTFTVCTGHQLCFGTGPLYFVYKIAGIISLAKDLSEKQENTKVVPVFWLASEDHDWLEANHLHFAGKKHQIDGNWQTAVGFQTTASAKALVKKLKVELAHLEDIIGHLNLFEKAYNEGKNLAAATRILVHSLFPETGLVILDGNDIELKRSFIPVMEKELFEDSMQQAIEEQSEKLSHAYFAQVNPREINLFYLDNEIRARITKSPDGYEIHNGQLVFSGPQLKDLLHKHPERFSPNVVLRPLYQEHILPNLAYVGGGGEIAYWLQLKTAFEMHGLTFPLIMLRNSFAFLSNKAFKKMEKYNIQLEDAFKDESVWIRERFYQDSEVKNLMNKTELWLKEIAASFKEEMTSFDFSLTASVEAEYARQVKGFKRLETKVLRSIKRKEEDALEAFRYIKSELFPDGTLQERKENILRLIQELGPDALAQITPSMNPLKKHFIIFEPERNKAKS